MPVRKFACGLERHRPGQMNKTEKRYADELDLQLKAGLIEWWGFESVKLKLANATFYTPDFMVLGCDGVIEFRETKGFWQDDARVKIKVAASQYWMFRFIALKVGKSGTWIKEDF